MHKRDKQTHSTPHISDEEDDVQTKPHQTFVIMKWLDENYTYEDGVCLPRCLIYEHYSDHCQRDGAVPINAASFGKLVHQQFSKITTRRLGTRGQSKYHYFGLGIKRSSPYYDESYHTKPNTGGKKEGGGRFSHRHYKNREKAKYVLPCFPSLQEVKDKSNPDLTLEKVRTFMVMYQAHCQRIYDSIIHAKFTEIGDFLLHFWQGMPPHLASVLDHGGVLDLIAYCDHVTYRSIQHVLVLTPLHGVPDSFAEQVLELVDSFPNWMGDALKDLPKVLKQTKMKVLRSFCQSLRRLTSMAKLAQATRAAMKSLDSPNAMHKDWQEVEVRDVVSHIHWILQSCDLTSSQRVLLDKVLEEFSELASAGLNLEDVVEWLETVVDRAFGEETDNSQHFLAILCQFWTLVMGQILKELMICQAASFGAYQLLSCLTEHYLLHLVDTRCEAQKKIAFMEGLHNYFVVKEPSPDPEVSQCSEESEGSSQNNSPTQLQPDHGTRPLLTTSQPQMQGEISLTQRSQSTTYQSRFVSQPDQSRYEELYSVAQPPTSVARDSEHQPVLQATGTIEAATSLPILPLNLQSTFTPPMQLPPNVDPAPPQPLTQLGVPLPPTQLFWRPIAGNHITAAVPGQLAATVTSVSASFPPNSHQFIPVGPPNPGVPVLHYVTPSPYMGGQVTSSLQVPPAAGTYYSN